MANPVDPRQYIYYKQALPFYSSGAWPNEFDAAYVYSTDDNSLNDGYGRYRTKIGTCPTALPDPLPWVLRLAGLSQFLSTDSDIALGYRSLASGWPSST